LSTGIENAMLVYRREEGETEKSEGKKSPEVVNQDIPGWLCKVVVPSPPTTKGM
jgi:hypothetical protein